MDQNPYSAPQGQTIASRRSYPLWRLAHVPVPLIILFGAAGLAGLFPSGHVVLFAVSVVVLVACMAYGIRGTLFGKKLPRWLTLTRESASRPIDSADEKRMLRIVFFIGVLGGALPAALFADPVIDVLTFFQVPVPALVFWSAILGLSSLTAYIWLRFMMRYR
jgi:hypothetical protein